MGNQFSQAFPPAPKFTETNLQDLKGKVYIVTGASAGVGKELARLLYSKNATVYLAARSEPNTTKAISWIKESHPASTGALHYMHVDLSDLASIKPAVTSFLAAEQRLDVLFNNAGVMVPPQGSKTAQGYELQLGTNCVGPFLLTKLLLPVLTATAAKEATGAVRVVWVSSSGAPMFAPKGGLDLNNLSYEKPDKRAEIKYASSKAGNVLHAVEMARRIKGTGVRSISLNPGNLRSDLQRHINWIQGILVGWMLHPPVNGAYTELFAGLAPEPAALKDNQWVIPWGRVGTLRKDFVEPENTGKFWEWTEEQVKAYV